MPIKRAESKSTAECFRWPSYPLDTAAKTASRLPAKRSAHRAGTQQQSAGMPTTRQEKITSPGQYHQYHVPSIPPLTIAQFQRFHGYQKTDGLSLLRRTDCLGKIRTLTGPVHSVYFSVH